MSQKRKEEYGNRVRKYRLGKVQIERELLLVEMLKEEGNYVTRRPHDRSKHIWMYSRRVDCEEGVTKV